MMQVSQKAYAALESLVTRAKSEMIRFREAKLAALAAGHTPGIMTEPGTAKLEASESSELMPMYGGANGSDATRWEASGASACGAAESCNRRNHKFGCQCHVRGAITLNAAHAVTGNSSKKKKSSHPKSNSSGATLSPGSASLKKPTHVPSPSVAQRRPSRRRAAAASNYGGAMIEEPEELLPPLETVPIPAAAKDARSSLHEKVRRVLCLLCVLY